MGSMGSNMPTPERAARVYGTPGERPRLRALLRILLPLLAGLTAGGYLLRAAWPVPVLSPAQAGGALVLVAVAMLVVIIANRARLDAFIKGAVGEEWVARVLAFLPAAYTVFHGLPLRGARGEGDTDIDHVVVGPTGVFVVETKNWSGRVSVRDGRILCDGREPSRPPLDQVRRATESLGARLGAAVGGPVVVQPVLCFRTRTPSGPETGVAGALVCDDHRLLDVIVNHHPDQPLDAAQCGQLADALRALVE